MIKDKKFYVTTPIYYVTAAPHLGSLYSTILADVASRWAKLQNVKTFFLTGTDEHGQKIMHAAQRAGKEPKEFVDSFISDYKKTWHDFEIDYTKFIRTTDSYHVKAVQNWLAKLLENGDIYKSFYTGWYCTPCETFVTEPDTQVQNPACASCDRATSIISEECYFFKLSNYQDKLLNFYTQNPNFITPKERFAEVISFVKSGLKDLSISRTTISWGIPFPNDSKHVTYVWADALNNYITGIGYDQSQKDFNAWWPADLHVMGKDIVRFHAVYWPAFLMASNLAMPEKLLVHGWLKINNQKMSKSFGNVIDPKHLLSNYGADVVRYYLTRHMATTQDSEFSLGDLEQRANSDLANDLGNLLNRVSTLALKFNLETIKPETNLSQASIELQNIFFETLKEFKHEMQEYYFYRALGVLWKFIAKVNSYFHTQEPWKLAPTNPDLFKEVIYTTCYSLYSIAILAKPVMPEKMGSLLSSLGIEFKEEFDWISELEKTKWEKTFKISKIDNLFNKYDAKEDKMQEEKLTEQIAPTIPQIQIEDLLKVTLAVGQIKQVEIIEKSDKLYKLQVDFGIMGTRQVLSGIRKSYEICELLEKQAVFVVNLAPRKMMGLESHGMILTAAGNDDKVKIIAPQGSNVTNGTILK